MKIAYFSRDRGGCGYYRVELPHETIAKHGAATVAKIEKGDNTDAISRSLKGADLVVIPRVSDELFLGLMTKIQAGGSKVAVEYDDNLFDISPLSPHFADYGDREITVEMDGESMKLWEDGRNINLKETYTRRECVKAAMSLADFTIVTTDRLAAEYSTYTDKFAVLPNCVDMTLWQSLPLKDDGFIRLYWSGGASHFEDFKLLQDVLPAVMERYKNTKVVIMGQVFDGTLAKLPTGRVEIHPWSKIDAYPYKTAIINPTISLIPLCGSRFDVCKSSIKWVEQSALGVPCVMSMVTPYKEMFDGENAVMVADNSPEQWFKGISMLIEDPLLRAKIGGAAQRTVGNHYDIDTQYHRWLDAYKRFV